MRAGGGRADLRAGAARHVRPGRRERLRSRLQRRRGAGPDHLCGRVPAGRAGIFPPQLRGGRHRDAVPPFTDAEAACRTYLDAGAPSSEGERHRMAQPAYDQCIKASHVFNLLDARGVISVTERQSYILRVRELAKACGAAWLKTAAGGVRRGQPIAGRPCRGIARVVGLGLPHGSERRVAAVGGLERAFVDVFAAVNVVDLSHQLARARMAEQGRDEQCAAGLREAAGQQDAGFVTSFPVIEIEQVAVDLGFSDRQIGSPVAVIVSHLPQTARRASARTVALPTTGSSNSTS